MPNDLERIGRPLSVIPIDHPVKPLVDSRSNLPEARLPDGTMSRSFHIVTTNKHLVKRIRPISEKKMKPHDYRNSLSTPERKGICDWCDQPRQGNPLHKF